MELAELITLAHEALQKTYALECRLCDLRGRDRPNFVWKAPTSLLGVLALMRATQRDHERFSLDLAVIDAGTQNAVAEIKRIARSIDLGRAAHV